MSQKSIDIVQTHEQFDAVLKTAKTFAPYLKVNSKGLLYIKADAKTIGVSSDEYKNFKKGVMLENQAIKNGTLTLVASKQGDVTKLTSKLPSNMTTGNTPNVINPDVSAGSYWWGFGLTLTEYETNGLEAALATCSGASWVAAELSAAGYVTLPASVPAGLIAAILSFGTGAIWLTDWAGGYKGITVGITWTGIPFIAPN